MPLSKYRISVCGCDSITRQKLKLYRKKIPDVRLFFAEKCSYDDESDICVMPAEHIPEYFKSAAPSRLLIPPAIAYGPPEAMALTLAAGCVDYLCEPWTPAEFFSRAACCRKPLTVAVGEGVLSLSPGRKLVCFKSEKPVGTEDLSRSEAVILTALLRNRGFYINRSMVSALLGIETVEASRAVDMQISRLRKKIATLLGHGRVIRTASGHGWTIDPD